MLNKVEVHKIDSEYNWVEVEVSDNAYPEAAVVRLVIEESPRMLRAFQEKYGAKRGTGVMLPDSQLNALKAFFDEAAMARAMRGGTDSTDLLELLPTTVLNFRYPEKSSFRKSRTARIALFLDEAESALYRRDFDQAMARLNWVHQLDDRNQEAYALKIVSLRTQKKMAECVPVFEAWIDVHPDDKRPRLGLGEMWLYLDQNQRADDAFEAVLEIDDKDAEALVGLAQARLRLGERPADALRKALVLAREYTTEMVETQFDFRTKNPDDLEPMTLQQVADRYRIPLGRVLERAKQGVLPMHPPDREDGFLRFSPHELDRYVEVLRYLGLELEPGVGGLENADDSSAEQRSLFNTADLDARPLATDGQEALEEIAADRDEEVDDGDEQSSEEGNGVWFEASGAIDPPSEPPPVHEDADAHILTPADPDFARSDHSSALVNENAQSWPAENQRSLLPGFEEETGPEEPGPEDRTTAEQFEAVDDSFHQDDEDNPLYRRTRPVDEVEDTL